MPISSTVFRQVHFLFHFLNSYFSLLFKCLLESHSQLMTFLFHWQNLKVWKRKTYTWPQPSITRDIFVKSPSFPWTQHGAHQGIIFNPLPVFMLLMILIMCWLFANLMSCQGFSLSCRYTHPGPLSTPPLRHLNYFYSFTCPNWKSRFFPTKPSSICILLLSKLHFHSVSYLGCGRSCQTNKTYSLF